MFCSKCGREISHGNKFCKKCGEEAAPAAQPETAKQLYYSVGCSNCFAPGCDRSYSYNGFDAYSWQYFKEFCAACQCLDIKSQSVWR